jgi:hypothetical protein
VPIPPPRSPAECVATLLQWLTQAVIDRGAGERLAAPVIHLIVARIRTIKQGFARLAARLAAGRNTPRRHTPRKRQVARTPRPKNPLPHHFGWLLPLVPEAICFRSQLEFLLRDPEMAALMATAPKSMGRVLRPLFWMLRLPPPPMLARPPREAKPSPAAPQAPQPQPSTPQPEQPYPQTPPPAPPAPPAPPVPARACGPPRPA